MTAENYWTRRLSRRHIIAGAGAGTVGVAGLALTGCGDDDGGDGQATIDSSLKPGTQTAATATPANQGAINKGGVLRSRQNAIFASINPWKGLDSGLLWAYTIYDHLFFTPLDTLKPELFLATTMETPDPTHVIFKIGESFFNDKPPVSGRKVTARDVKASYEAARVQPGVSQTTFSTAVFDHIDTPDDNTVVVVLKTPDAWMFTTAGLGGPIFGSIHPQEVTAQPDFMDRELIGSGRYEFVSHQNGTNFKLKRFDKWRIKGEPYLAGIEYKLIQEQAAALVAFAAKEIDSVALNNKFERDQVKNRAGDSNITIDSDLSRSLWVVQCRGDGRWADPRVRKAINLGLDRKKYIELMALGDGRMSGIVPPAFGAVQLTEKELSETLWKFDPGEGKRLLAEASFDTKEEFQIKFPSLGDNFSKFAQITKSQLEENLGVTCRLVAEDFGTWLAQSLYGSNYNGLLLYPTLAYEEPMTYMAMYEKQIGGRDNWGKYFDDELDGMIRKVNQTLDDTERFEAVKAVQRKAIEKVAPIFPVFVKVDETATWNYVKGRVTGRGSYGFFTGQAYIDK